jgi:hypothetical protein
MAALAFAMERHHEQLTAAMEISRRERAAARSGSIAVGCGGHALRAGLGLVRRRRGLAGLAVAGALLVVALISAAARWAAVAACILAAAAAIMAAVSAPEIAAEAGIGGHGQLMVHGCGPSSCVCRVAQNHAERDEKDAKKGCRCIP